jgi:hypothetical protein
MLDVVGEKRGDRAGCDVDGEMDTGEVRCVFFLKGVLGDRIEW